MRYEVQDWVCDYGIWDNVLERFYGNAIESSEEAKIICKWVNESLSHRERYVVIQNGFDFYTRDRKLNRLVHEPVSTRDQAENICESLNKTIL